MSDPKKHERGFVMGLALMGIVALTVVGISAVYLASGEVDMAGNLRRKHQIDACASAGLQAVFVQIPDTDETTVAAMSLSYPTAEGQKAALGHFSGTSGYTPSIKKMPATAVSNVFLSGENLSNRLSGAPGRMPYRTVVTCQDAAGTSKTEMSGAILYGAGR